MRFYAITFLFVLLVLCAVPAFAEEVVTLSSNNLQFALDPDSGMIAAIDNKAAKVSFYDKDIALLSSESVGKGPVKVAFKKFGEKSYFIVLSRDEPTMIIFDAKTQKKLKTIQLNLIRPCMLAVSSNPADPLVYYSTEKYIASVVDLRTMLEKTGIRINYAYHISVSLDGSRLFTASHQRHNGRYVSASVVNCKCDIGVKTIVPGNKLISDTFGHYYASGISAIYSSDLQRLVGRTPNQVVAFFPDKAAMLGINSNRKLSLISYNSFRQIQEIALPNTSHHLNNFPWVCLVDAARKRVLVCRGNQIINLNYAEFEFPKEPHLIAKVKGPSLLQANQKITYPIETLDKRVKYELHDAPKGAKMEDGKIVWTPTDEQIGSHNIALRVYFEKVEKIVTFSVNVSKPHAKLAFAPNTMRISDNAKLIVFAQISNNRSNRDRYNKGQGKTTEDQLLLYDVDTGKTLATRTFKKHVGAFWVDEHYAYYAPNDTTVFYALSLKDLSDVKRIFCTGNIKSFSHNYKGELVIHLSSGTGGDVVYSLPDLKRISVPKKAERYSKTQEYYEKEEYMYEQDHRYYERGRGGSVKNGSLQNGFRIKNGAIYDKDGKLAMVYRPRSYKDCVSDRSSICYPEYRWNRWIRDGQIQTPDGMKLGRINTSNYHIMEKYPAVMGVIFDSKDNRYTISYEIRDMINAKVVNHASLLDIEQIRVSNYNNFKFTVVEDKAFILIGKGFFTIELTPEMFKGVTEPLHIVPKIAKNVVAADGILNIKYQAKSGTQPYTYTLMSDCKGLTLDAKTGALKIEGSVFAEAALKSLIGNHDRIYREMQNEAEAKARGRDYVASSSCERFVESYKEIIGEAPKGIPVTIPITVNITDANGQSCTISHRVFLLISADKVAKGKAAIRKDIMAQIEKRQEEKKRYEDARRQGGGSEATQRQIMQLNQRVAALEAKVDLLLKLLQAQNGGKNNGDEKKPDDKKHESPKNEEPSEKPCEPSIAPSLSDEFEGFDEDGEEDCDEDSEEDYDNEEE